MYNVHCFPVFRVCIKGLQGTPKEVAAAAEMAVGVALNDFWQRSMTVYVLGQGNLNMEFADKFDASYMDVIEDGEVLRSFQSDLHTEAVEHAETLGGLIDGENDDLGKLLGPIKSFLETVR